MAESYPDTDVDDECPLCSNPIDEEKDDIHNIHQMFTGTLEDDRYAASVMWIGALQCQKKNLYTVTIMTNKVIS